MKVEYDLAKNERNIQNRGLSFDLVAGFDFSTALILVDDRRDYGELRYIGIGYLRGRLHFVCFVERGAAIRVISFRKASQREVREYAKAQTLN